MSQINFKKLVSRKNESAMLRDLADRCGSGYAIWDATNTVVAGEDEGFCEKTPVEIDGEVVGWASDGQGGTVLASLLRYFVIREVEKVSLVMETLQKYKEITILYDLAGKIAASLNIKEVAKLVIDEALKVINADNVSLMIIDQESGRLEILGATGKEYHPKTAIRIGTGIAGHVATTGKAEIIDSVEADPRFVEGSNIISSLICAPLKIKERIVGVINFSCEERYNFTAEDLRMAETLAFQAALSIDNARFVDRLRESEKESRLLYEQYHSLYENAVEGIFQMIPDGRFISVNPSVARMFGYDSPDEVILTLTDIATQLFVDAEDHARYRSILLDKSQVIGFETQMHRRGGHQIWVSISARIVNDEQGIPIFIEGALLDITERKEKEEAKREREAADIKSRFIRETFGRYLSDEIVDTILEDPAGLTLGGEKRTVTIMMTDLRGFTSIGERLPAEDVVGMINIYLEVMTRIIFKYQGTIDEFIGDAILVIFGAPALRDDDALRGVACALDMQLAMQEVNERNRAAGYPEVFMGIGINTGSAVVGNIGSRKRVKYGVVGSNVNLTSRIESYTVGGQILISESTARACGEHLRIDGKLEVMPKGVKTPITIYEVGGIGCTFNLFLPEQRSEDMPELLWPLEIRFAPLVDKDAGIETHNGLVKKLSERVAEVHAEISMEKLTNLRISLLDHLGATIATDIYAKVIDHVAGRPSAFRIHFTSIAPETVALMKQMANMAQIGENSSVVTDPENLF
ncbi:MAG: adenylate/guanylate cyclase domain-containing protein [Desulfuromonadaceae bacterium]|nr:adenylate/guanylate cyclase domain-containing protein [Desulfuromonadaceae bacterium]